MLIDRHLPRYDTASRHEARIRASPEQVYEALQTVDFGRSWVVRGLLLLRGLTALLARRGGLRTHALTLSGFLDAGFVLLEARPPRGVVLGLIGRFWTLSGGLVQLDRERFAEFDEPGFARAAWSFELVPAGGEQVRLITETRVLCSDPVSRRHFRRYWRFVAPFSGWIRRLMLRRVRQAAEAAGSRPAAKQNPQRRV